MGDGVHFTLYRDTRWLFRMALIALLLGGGILLGWYLGDGDGWFYGDGKIRYVLIPLCHFLVLIAPAFAWAGRNKLPVLMLTDTALLYRANLWSSRFKGIRRSAIRSTSIHDNRYHGNTVARSLCVQVDDLRTARLEPAGLGASIGDRMNKTILGSAIVLPCAGWPLAPEDVKARVDAWVAEIRR